MRRTIGKLLRWRTPGRWLVSAATGVLVIVILWLRWGLAWHSGLFIACAAATGVYLALALVCYLDDRRLRRWADRLFADIFDEAGR